MQNSTRGTWNILGFNLPDMGWTETLLPSRNQSQQTFLNNPRVTGSTVVPYTKTPSTGATGADYNFPRPDSNIPQPNNTGGGGNVLGDNTSQPIQQPNQVDEGLNNAINEFYDPTMNYLNQAEQTLNNALPSVQQDIEGLYNTSRQSLETERGRGEREISAREQQAGQTREDAMAAATRLYNETQLGGQQRFGRASGVGQAFQELANRELMRNQGGVQRDYAQAQMQVAEFQNQLQERFTTAISQLEQQKNTAMNDARREHEQKLLEISRMRSAAESEKAAARLQALQDLRNKVFSINMQDLQFKQQLAQMNQAGQAQVQNYAQQVLGSIGGAGQAADTFGQQVDMNPQTALNVNPAGAGQAGQNLTGRINPNRREDEFGFNPIAMA